MNRRTIAAAAVAALVPVLAACDPEQPAPGPGTLPHPRRRDTYEGNHEIVRSDEP